MSYTFLFLAITMEAAWVRLRLRSQEDHKRLGLEIKMLDWLATYFSQHSDGGQRKAQFDASLLRSPEFDPSFCLSYFSDRRIPPATRCNQEVWGRLREDYRRHVWAMFCFDVQHLVSSSLHNLYNLLSTAPQNTYFNSHFSDLCQHVMEEKHLLGFDSFYSPPGTFHLEYARENRSRMIPVAIDYDLPPKSTYFFGRKKKR